MSTDKIGVSVISPQKIVIIPISVMLKNGGLLVIAYPFTFSIGVALPEENSVAFELV